MAISTGVAAINKATIADALIAPLMLPLIFFAPLLVPSMIQEITHAS